MYYGFTSPVGIVNLVTKRAGPDPVTSFALSGNQYGQAVAQVDVGRRFGDEGQYGARMNLVGGELRNAIDGVKGSRSLGALALDWRANSTVSFKLDYENIRKDITEQAVIVAPGTGATLAGARYLPQLPDPKKLLSGNWATYDANAENVLLRSDINIADNWSALVEWGRAETVRSRNELDIQNYDLVTGQSAKSAYYSTNHNINVNTNLRAEITGRLTGFLDHEVTLGVTDNERFNNAPAVPSNLNVTQNLYNPVVIAQPTVTPTSITSPQSISDKGLYVFDRIRIGDAWQVIGGLRWEDYKDTKVANTATTSTTTVQKLNKVNPSLSLLYKVRPDTSIYASYIEGLEEGGVAASTYVNAGEVLPAAISRQKEVGVRTEAFHGVTGALAYFELERAAAARNAANYYVLDGRTKYSGIEASASGEVTPEVSLTGAAMFLNAKLTNQTNTLWNGNTPDNTAKTTYSLFAEYRPHFAPGFAVNGGAYYIAKRPLDNLDINYLPGYTIFTAGARYTTRIATKTTTFQVNVENLGDKRYWSAANTGYIAEGLPLTVSFVVKVDL
jgi:iron complex outermembrane receptor protein